MKLLCLSLLVLPLIMPNTTKADNMPPPSVVQSIFISIDVICKNYPYKDGSNWTDHQQIEWGNQLHDRHTMPSAEQVNIFCQDKGYK